MIQTAAALDRLRGPPRWNRVSRAAKRRRAAMDKELKGLFGGGEAGTAPSAPAAQPPQPAREGRQRRRDAGGGGGGRRRRRFNPAEDPQAQDFVQRYLTGHPSEGFSSDEAVN